MIIKFYINGMCIETYKCKGNAEQLSAEDEQAIDKIKRDAFRNFGYPVLTEVIMSKGGDTI